MGHQLDITDHDLSQFLERLFETYHFDFREYGKAHLKRRIRHRMTLAKYNSFEDLAEDVIHHKSAFEAFFRDLSINVTELFRDPLFFKSLYQFLEQQKLDHPLKIWVSACATGEEAFSMMMMLEHFHISYDSILATDFNKEVVQRASTGRMETAYIKEYLKNMTATEFGLDFYQFFEFKREYYQLKDIYKERLQFKYHNLLDPPDFGDFDMVLCRNVLIYFEKELQNKVTDYISNSLRKNGLLCLGAKESLRFIRSYPEYLTIHQAHKIYQKK